MISQRAYFSSITETMIVSFAAGILIAIASFLYTVVPNKIVGALMFGFAISTIIFHEFPLYTKRAAKLGDVCDGDDVFLLWITCIWNIAGAIFAGVILGWFQPEIAQGAMAIVESKLAIANVFKICFSGVMCTFLLYFTSKENMLLNLLLVGVFILCGFEHLIADVSYMAIAGKFSIGFLGLVFVGNTLGCFLTGWFSRLRKNLKKIQIKGGN